MFIEGAFLFIFGTLGLVGTLLILCTRAPLFFIDKDDMDCNDTHKGIVKNISFTSYPSYANKDEYTIQLEDGNYVTVHETVHPPYSTGEIVTVFKKGDVYTFEDKI